MNEMGRVFPLEMILIVILVSAELRRCGRGSGILEQINDRGITAQITLSAGSNHGVNIIFAFRIDIACPPNGFFGLAGQIGSNRSHGFYGLQIGVGGLRIIEGNGSISGRVKSKPTDDQRIFHIHFFGRDGEIDGRIDYFTIMHEFVRIEGISHGVVCRKGYLGRICRHIERREARNLLVEHRIFIIDNLLLLRIIGVPSTSGSHIVDTVFIEVLEGVIISGKGNDTFAFRCIFLENRRSAFGLIRPLSVIAGGIDSDMMTNDDPRQFAFIENRIQPDIFATSYFKFRA